MTGEQAFEAFCQKFGNDAGNEVMERIADALWNRKGDERLTVRDIHSLNACNHVIDGDIEHEGAWFSFSVESGDRNGTVVHGWGDFEDVAAYVPERPTLYDLMPRDRSLEISHPGMFRVYLAWRNEKWCSELVRSYNYDRHFAPGGKTENYWRERAAQRGLIYAVDTDVNARIAEFKSQNFEEKRQETINLAAQWGDV